MDNKCVEKLLETVAFSNGCICSVELIRWEHTHFHPSGDMMPSKEDIMITDRMAKICTMVGIPLIDHVIVGDDNHSYFSFKEKGMVEYKGSIRYETDLKHIHLDKVAERSMKDDEVYRR